jgi:hypothetical protein
MDGTGGVKAEIRAILVPSSDAKPPIKETKPRREQHRSRRTQPEPKEKQPDMTRRHSTGSIPNPSPKPNKPNKPGKSGKPVS